MKRFMGWFSLLCVTAIAVAQTNFYFVSFTDKEGSDHIALSALALEKRQAQGIEIDEQDWAVSDIYVDSLVRAGARVSYTSRWLNGATVEMSEALAAEMINWSFVQDIDCTRVLNGGNASGLSQRKNMPINEEPEVLPTPVTRWQLEMMNLTYLQDLGYKGQGKTIAVLDAGFPAVDTSAAFARLREEGRLLGQYDFGEYDIPFSSPDGAHGSHCFSILAAEAENYFPAAPEASYYLMKTEEMNSESRKESDNWVAAIELADSLGVDIVSSSLGYFLFDDAESSFSYDMMNGMTTRISIAATIAAEKGLLVCNAAGNTANYIEMHWPWIMAPGDALGTITVGAVSADSVYASFSSIGPSFDLRVKPELVAMGVNTRIYNSVQAELRQGNGTSFACPLMAGMAACLWSAMPEVSNQEIRERLIRSGHLYETPNVYLGYGLPDGKKALEEPTSIQAPTQSSTSASVRKILYNGVMYLIRDNRVYSISGSRVRL